jgi:rhodanese-related sulfurtransferase
MVSSVRIVVMDFCSAGWENGPKSKKQGAKSAEFVPSGSKRQAIVPQASSVRHGRTGTGHGRRSRTKRVHRIRFPWADVYSDLMDSPDDILSRARERARAMKLPYAGALLPAEAHALLKQRPDAKLVDVRTQAELEWVGRVPGAVAIEWNTWPGGKPNPDFLRELQEQVKSPEAPVMFLCRSGGRSHNAAAAASQAGYADAFNVLEGFEGDKDTQGHRNAVGGWRFAGLPWVQG